MSVKRCSGYKGHWECGEDYPDHILPISEFHKHSGSKDGLQDKCIKCKIKVINQTFNPKNNPKRKVWYKLAGGQKEYYNLSKEERAKIRAKANNVEWKINDKVVDITPRFKSEYGPSKPMTKRETVHVEGEVVPQGWVYVIRNTETPWLFKIGKTYPDGMQGRLSEARRWGCFKLEEKYWFEDALKAEKEVHALLREHNMRNLGFEDCGTELFKCWNIGIITDAINKVQSGNDRPSLAMGK